MRPPLRIGTRRSPLAVWQAEHVKELLQNLHPGLSCTLVQIVTQGDTILDKPLAQIGGKGLFVKEIEAALLRGDIDLAVHSMKDLPAGLPQGLRLAAIPPREDPRDALLCREPGLTLHDLPARATIGTSSLRRAAQLRFHRPDLVVEPSRGNVETRIRRLQEGRFDAIVLACAGLARLGLSARIDQFLDTDVCLPAVGQGVLAIEIRQDDSDLARLLEPLNDPATASSVAAERTFLSELQGSCQVPLAALATLSGPTLTLTGLLANLDGSLCIRRTAQGPAGEARDLGSRLALEIRAAGGEEILAEIRREASNVS